VVAQDFRCWRSVDADTRFDCSDEMRGGLGSRSIS